MKRCYRKNRNVFRFALSACACTLIAVGGLPARADETSTPPVDDMIARAIKEVTGRDARPDEVNPSRFGLGYEQIRARVEATYYVCDDPTISRAIIEVTGRAPRGAGNEGECNPQLYGVARDYAALKAGVQSTLVDKPYAMGICRSADLTRAISEVKKEMGMENTVPLGAGELGECNSGFYGSYVSYDELKNNVREMLTNFKAAGVGFASAPTRGGDCAWWDLGCQASRFRYWVAQQWNQPGATVRFTNGTTARNLGNGQVQVRDSYGNIILNGGGNLVNTNGSNYAVISNGRIVAQGGLN